MKNDIHEKLIEISGEDYDKPMTEVRSIPPRSDQEVSEIQTLWVALIGVVATIAIML